MRELSCKLDRDPSVTVRVQFQRLHESAAGVLLNNGKAPWTARVYGNVTVLDNLILRQYRDLIGRFATRVRYDKGPGEVRGLEFGVVGLEQPPITQGESLQPPGVVETFELPLRMEGPLVDEIQHILKEKTWPPDFHLTYGGYEVASDQASPFQHLQAWRYLTRADIDRLPASLNRYNSLVGREGREWIKYRNQTISKALPLLRYLTADGLPERFRYFSSPVYGEGCEALTFTLSRVKFEVDVAIIHNMSPKVLRIDRLIGAQDRAKGLRRFIERDEGAPNGVESLLFSTAALQPGETLIVPLRLIFAPEWPEKEGSYAAAARKNGERRYQLIRASRPGTEFKLLIGTDLKIDQRRAPQSDAYIVIKKRESFTPHSQPEEGTYKFGPEWLLSEIHVGGEQLSLVKPERDAVHFTVAGGAGSCPIDRDEFGSFRLSAAKTVERCAVCKAILLQRPARRVSLGDC